MKATIKIFLVAVLFLLPVYGYSQDSDPGDMYLRFIEGDVQIKTEDTGEWVPAAANTPLLAGDRIWVPQEGRAEILMKDGTVVRLGEASLLEISVVEKEGVQLFLAGGRSYINFTGPRQRYLVLDTPSSGLQPAGKSIFRAEVSEEGDSTVAVLKGEVLVDRDKGEMKIAAGEGYVFHKDNRYPELARRSSPDEWEQWNRERDGELYEPYKAYNREYLPNELRPYASDLDNNGRWVYTQDYGYVWTPTVILARDWSPYRIGRWVWIGGDYVWVSYEPWGWAPYHYGRWAYVRSVGWGWVPPARGNVYWAPGYVAWVQTASHVSWVPLAPRETYYGRGHYGPYSVTIARATVDRAVVSNANAYRNVHANNAVVTVSHDAFLRGNGGQANVKENPFLTAHAVTPTPQIQPVRATRMPAIKEIAPLHRPPQHVDAFTPAMVRKSFFHQAVPLTAGRASAERGGISRGRPALPDRNPLPGRPFSERDSGGASLAQERSARAATAGQNQQVQQDQFRNLRARSDLLAMKRQEAEKRLLERRSMSSPAAGPVPQSRTLQAGDRPRFEPPAAARRGPVLPAEPVNRRPEAGQPARPQVVRLAAATPRPSRPEATRPQSPEIGQRQASLQQEVERQARRIASEPPARVSLPSPEVRQLPSSRPEPQRLAYSAPREVRPAAVHVSPSSQPSGRPMASSQPASQGGGKGRGSRR